MTGVLRAAGVVLGALVWIASQEAFAGHHESGAGPSRAKPTSIAAIEAFIAERRIDTRANNWKIRLPKPPQVEFEPGERLFWNLETSVGDIVIRLLPDLAPMHVSSTIYLTQLGFYDGTLFHRVIKGFMAQGGDPLGRGSGHPGYQYDPEIDPGVRHDRGGLLSMANRGLNPDGSGTDGSQFFLTFRATPSLDGKHTIFGRVVRGHGTLKKLEARGGVAPEGRPIERLVLERATITTR